MSSVKLFHHPSPVTIKLKQGGKTVRLNDYIAEKCPSLVGPKAYFSPTPYLFNGHLQTGYAAYYNGSPTMNDVCYEREMLPLPDGGQVSVDWCPPLPQKPFDDTPTLVCLHGLTGGSHESYIRGVLEVITRPPFNYRAVVFNARGCGNTELTTPQLFNGAYTDDLRHVLKHIQKQLPEGTPLAAIGFSLGSNILVKYLGEEGEKAPFVAAMSVANPFDFVNSGYALDRNYIIRKVYSGTMAGNLKRAFGRHAEMLCKNKDVSLDEVMSATTIRQFDDACTRKVFGYSTVNNYYRDASSCRFIEHVRIPLLCMNALDDPISPAESIPYDEIKINPHVILATTDYGGHIGWFEHFRHPTRWVVKPLAEFIVAMFEAHDTRQLPKEARLSPETIDRSVDAIQAEE
ncbi:Alpha/Beta hydrolase protein [Fennellomyces sp. T-0311]|nr:Alpha/Beta hydrolase protein [Fennellomyces sp. T-0311]